MSDRLRCVLTAVGDPPFLFVQLLREETTLYSRRIKEPDDATAVGRDLWATFVKDAH